MRYINTVTKATIDTEFKISGGDWVLEDELKTEVEPETETETETEVKSEEVKAPEQETTGDEAYDAITVAQIKQELDAFGIEYDKKATKRVLYDLMLSQGE